MSSRHDGASSPGRRDLTPPPRTTLLDRRYGLARRGTTRTLPHEAGRTPPVATGSVRRDRNRSGEEPHGDQRARAAPHRERGRGDAPPPRQHREAPRRSRRAPILPCLPPRRSPLPARGRDELPGQRPPAVAAEPTFGGPVGAPESRRDGRTPSPDGAIS